MFVSNIPINDFKGVDYLYKILETIATNKEWVFSGIGVFAIGFLFTKKRPSIIQKQKSGNNSINIQVGRDYETSSKERSVDKVARR